MRKNTRTFIVRDRVNLVRRSPIPAGQPDRFFSQHLPARRAKISLFFEAMENWVERSRADSVAVATELFEHAKTKNRFFRGMMKHMKPDQAGVEISIIILWHSIRLRPSALIGQPTSAGPLVAADLEPPLLPVLEDSWLHGLSHLQEQHSLRGRLVVLLNPAVRPPSRRASPSVRVRVQLPPRAH